jgi:catechol 2,3-dioxygenase-like lactoylglutathione lyase family enzyme
MTLRVTNVVIDCRDLERATAFWSAALGYERGSADDGWQSLCAPGVSTWRVSAQAPGSTWWWSARPRQ